MIKILKINFILFLAVFFYPLFSEPKVIIFIIIDQLNNNYIQKLKPYFSGGLGYIIDNGAYFANAFYEHSMPATASGHSMLSTGTFANYHGVINNSWYTPEGKKVKFGRDLPYKAAVFSKNGFYNYGFSAHHLMTDTLADQLVMHSYPHARNTVWCLSLKARAAIAMSGRLGNPIWFDEQTGWFTSSKAFFKKLPGWVTEFNKKDNIDKLTNFTWNLANPEKSLFYNFDFINNYKYATDKTVINKTFSINHKEENPYTFFAKTPAANKLLVDLAKTCITKYIPKSENERLVLFLSLSGLDKIGHLYGPHSKENIDMLYHMDKDLTSLINLVYKKIYPEDVLFILTGDHGIMPIPEILQEQDFSLSQRIDPIKVLNTLNKCLEHKYGIKRIVQHFMEHQLYINKSKLPQDKKLCNSIYNDVKKLLESIPGIRKAWTFKELSKDNLDKTFNLDTYIKRQLYKGRSGDIIYSIDPYTYMSSYHGITDAGSSHISPYAYDTHVPLYFYQKNIIQKLVIPENVGMQQIAPTLATLLNVQRPSASKSSVLPKIVTKALNLKQGKS